MANNETRVRYKAIADFSALSTAVTKLRKELRELRDAEGKQNTKSKNDAQRVSTAYDRKTKSLTAANAAMKEHLGITKDLNKATAANKRSQEAMATVFNNKKKAVAAGTRALKEHKTAQAGASAAKDVSTGNRSIASSFDAKEKSVSKATKALKDHTTATRQSSETDRGFQSSLKGTEGLLRDIADAVGRNSRSHRTYRSTTDRSTGSTVRFRRAVRDANGDIRIMPSILSQAARGSTNFYSSLRRLGNWRPRFIPPFIALIPAIAGVLGALNPLIALFGAAGGAALGLASSLGSLAGAALALPGILGAVAVGVGSLIASFSGIGGAFKAFGQMQKAGGGGGGAAAQYRNQAREIQRATEDIADAQQDLGRTYEDSAEAIEDAERRVQRAQKDAIDAQEDLNEARRDALRDLIDLRKEVSRAGLNEERAIANLTQAQEEYNRVFADPGSTLGDKQDAIASVKEAEADLADVRQENIQNQEDLTKAEAKGVEGSDRVVDARERLTEAMEEQKDAYRDLERARQDEARNIQDAIRRVEDAYESLRKAQEPTPGAGGGGGGLDKFQEALDKLSPSARAFVLGILSMRDAWLAMVDSVQENFFSRIVGDLETIRGLIPNVGTVLSRFSGVLGDLAHNAIQAFASDEWQKDFLQFGEDGSKLIGSMGRASGALADAFRHLIMAAAPFTDWLVGALADGAENFRDLVKSGRETGELAKWLETVRSRLEQWWRIVKNIAGTLFNYGAATAEFGKWITDGLESLTEGWLANSEEANKENSKFKQWLEDIKPLLSELKQLAADFFGWFSRESMDLDNIEQMTSILEILRTELGPALTSLFDNLSEAGLGEALVESLAAIVQAISDLVEAGGGDAFKAFYDILTAFFKGVSEFVKTPGVSDILQGVGTALGVIAALSFIGKFTGLTNLIGWLIKAAGTAGMLPFLSALAGIAAIGAIQQHYTDAAIEANNSSPIEETTYKDEEQRRRSNEAIEDNGPWRMPSGSTGGSRGVINPAGGGGNILDEGTQGEISTILEDTFGGMAQEFNGSIDKWSNGWTQIQNGWKGTNDWLRTAWQGVVDWWNEGWSGTVEKFENGWNQITTWWEETNTNIETWWNDVVTNFKNGWVQIETWWNEVVTNFKNGWAVIEGWWNDVVENFKRGWSVIETWWGEVVTNFKNGWAVVEAWWNDVVNNFRLGWTIIEQWWSEVVTNFKNGWAVIEGWWSSVVDNFNRGWDTIKGWWDTAINTIAGAFSGIYDGIVNAVKNAFSGLGTWFNDLFGNMGGLVPPTKPGPVKQTPSQADRSDSKRTQSKAKQSRHFNRGGEIQHFAGGGRLKPTNRGKSFRQIGTDTVPAMLTPGEFILRKSIVDAIGVDNLLALNTGMVSYSDMLNGFLRDQKNVDKQREKPKQDGDGLSYFSGGGLAGGATMDHQAISRNDYSASLRNQQTVTNNNGITVENLNVNNPTPEPASDSLPRSIRKVAYMANARGSR